MRNSMAYGRVLVAAAWVVAVVACGDDGGSGTNDGGVPMNVDAPPATAMYVGPAGIGQEDNPAYDGLTQARPIATLTQALSVRLTERKYRSVTEIVLLPGEYYRNETFPIRVIRPQSIDRLTIRGGAATVDRAVIRNDRNNTPSDQLTLPILDVGPGVTIQNLTIENRYNADTCLGQLQTVILAGEAEARQIVFDRVVITGGSPCHTHVAVEANANVLFQNEIVIDGGDKAGGLTTTIDGRFANNSVIEFRGNENRNCTGIRFLNMGPQLSDMGMPRLNTGNPAISVRGENTAVFDQVCIRPGASRGERRAVFVRGETDITFTGLEIQTSDGTINGQRFTRGIEHSPTAGTTATTIVDGASIDVAGTGIFVNGGSTTINAVDFTQSDWAIQRINGDLSVRDCEFDQHRFGGIELGGHIADYDAETETWTYDSIDLGTEPRPDDTATEATPGDNTFRFQGEDGDDGDVKVQFDAPQGEEPMYDLTIPAMGQRAWSPTIRMDVVCRNAAQQDDFNVDVRTPGVRVEFRPGEFCEGYMPPM